MGRKSSAKGRPEREAPAAANPRGSSPYLLGAMLVAAAVGVAGLAFWRSTGTAVPGSTAAGSAPSPGAAASGAPATAPQPTPEIEAAARAAAALGPHRQANLPPIPFRGYSPPRAPEVVTAAFHFAAEHPEIASYVPCYCGCERSGHRGNADCFVKSRAANGDVIEWEEHGVECAVCIDVATRSRQMLAVGLSARDIRAAIEKEFSPHFPSQTPTPRPPAPSSGQ